MKVLFKITGIKVVIAVVLVLVAFGVEVFYATHGNIPAILHWLFTPLPMVINTVIYGYGSGPEFPNLITIVSFIINLLWYYFIACCVVYLFGLIKRKQVTGI